jgi:hypothetical protein
MAAMLVSLMIRNLKYKGGVASNGIMYTPKYNENPYNVSNIKWG